MASNVLKWKPRKSALEANLELIESLTAKRIQLRAESRALDHAIAGAYLEREKLVRELRKR